LKFGEIHGHYNVPRSGNFQCDLPDFPDEHGNSAFNAKLGNWVYWQRELRKGGKSKSSSSSSKLTPEREALLQALADEGKFNWDTSINNPVLLSKQRGDMEWPKCYAALIQYGQEFGTYNIPDKRFYRCEFENGDVYEGKLGYWLSWQRSLKKGLNSGSSLRPDREALLQTLVETGNFYLLYFVCRLQMSDYCYFYLYDGLLLR